jgi:hypothetical protein
MRQLQRDSHLPSGTRVVALPHLRSSSRAPSACPEPKCRNPAIRFAGIGTERVEETLTRLFPKARIRRMDSDTLKRKEDYRRILGDFRTGKIDILLGTQMIAKGLHFPMSPWSASSTPIKACINRISAPAKGPSNSSPRWPDARGAETSRAR